MLKDIRVQRSKELRGGLLAKRHWSVCLERLEKMAEKNGEQGYNTWNLYWPSKICKT